MPRKKDVAAGFVEVRTLIQQRSASFLHGRTT
jgi:hypothetical protein